MEDTGRAQGGHREGTGRTQGGHMILRKMCCVHPFPCSKGTAFKIRYRG